MKHSEALMKTQPILGEVFKYLAVKFPEMLFNVFL